MTKEYHWHSLKHHQQNDTHLNCILCGQITT